MGGRFFLNNTNPHHSNRHSDGDPYHFPLGTTFDLMDQPGLE